MCVFVFSWQLQAVLREVVARSRGVGCAFGACYGQWRICMRSRGGFPDPHAQGGWCGTSRSFPAARGPAVVRGFLVVGGGTCTGAGAHAG